MIRMFFAAIVMLAGLGAASLWWARERAPAPLDAALERAAEAVAATRSAAPPAPEPAAPPPPAAAAPALADPVSEERIEAAARPFREAPLPPGPVDDERLQADAPAAPGDEFDPDPWARLIRRMLALHRRTAGGG